MIQQDRPQSNPGAIEALKAATRQVVQPAPRDEQSGSPAAKRAVAPKNFTEAFIEKITLVEQEKAKVEKEQLAVQQELGRVQKLHSDLTEKKKQLEARKDELIKVKDKLTALDKEISEALKFPSP